ncbi:MAG: glycosyltransferase family 2 protein [Bacteroidales bacterium]|nr:glycosyltransferase family 2 protein [Candidatus Cryptobacteroides caccocaballi]
MEQPMRICVVMPTYRNAGTVADVVRRTLEQLRELSGSRVIVVNDGSPDSTDEVLEGLPVTVVKHRENKGKGAALKTGFEKALEMGYDHVITIDSDGQHFPEDIPVFLDAIRSHPDSIITGSRNLLAENMPGKNTFANKFSNFWFRLQTLRNVPDTQTGFRAYPLKGLPNLGLLTSRYEAELELLVLSAWKGTPVHPVQIRVYYPPEGERISSFHPFWDFFRISVLNTVLCLLALVYGYPRMALTWLFRLFRRAGR